MTQESQILEPEFWYIVFCNPQPLCQRSSRYWKNKALYRVLSLLKSGFRHCYAFAACPDQKNWMVFNPCSTRHFMMLSPVKEGFPLQGSGPHSILLVSAQQRVTWQPRLLFSCVSHVAHLLGVSGSLTPYQFYRSLLQEALMGGVLIPKANNSALEQQLAETKAEQERLEKENEARRRNIKNRADGRRSLLAFQGGSMLSDGGTVQKTKLGD